MSKSKKAYEKRKIKMHFAVAESANHILALIGKVLMSIGNHHVPDSIVKFKSFYPKCLTSEPATECWRKYDVAA